MTSPPPGTPQPVSGPPVYPVSGPPAHPAPGSRSPARSVAREAELVELVDDQGVFTGTATVLAAHEAPGMQHRAFSVFLRDPSGRVLLQQRAAAKTRFPLRWGNTCCGHPAPGEPVTVSAGRRVAEELGIDSVPLDEVGVYVYFAEDPITGRVEREYDHVLLGELPDGMEFRPDPDEVARLRWVSVADLRQELVATPTTFAPWLDGVTQRLAEHLHPFPAPAPAPALPEPALPEPALSERALSERAPSVQGERAPEWPGDK